MARFKDKVVVVAGAGSIGPGWGNGKAAALVYAREGATVVAGDINLEAAQETQGIIEKEGGVCSAKDVDVCSQESVEEFFKFVQDTYGRVDVLHNNVGVTLIKPVAEHSLEEWESGIAINLNSTFLTCRSAIALMKANGGGAIVNTSSIADRRWVGVSMPSYASAKAAVVQLTRSIALENAAYNIRANVVVPGYMDTPTIVAAYTDTVSGEIEKMRAKRSAAVPLGRMGDAWDIANAAAFLASDDARYITGTELLVDGGLTSSMGYEV
ncbi:MAG: SDR family NAD(P)-dependent oxidoreductase [Pseudomonadota bacterium]